MAHVYLCSSPQALGYALELVDALERKGFEVWQSPQSTAPPSWLETRKERIGTCAAFIVLMTTQGMDSGSAQEELAWAQERERFIVPLLLSGRPWLTLAHLRYRDVRGGKLPPDPFYTALEQAVHRDAALAYSSPLTTPPSFNLDDLLPDSLPQLGPPPGGLLESFRSWFRGQSKGLPGGQLEAHDTDDPGVKTSPTEPVQMSAYYPQEVAPRDRHPLKAYVYRASAAGQVRQDARRRLGSLWEFLNRSSARATQPIAQGAHVTATPQLDGFEFEPVSVTIAFREAWHRLDFELRAVDAPLDQDALGSIAFTVEGILVADVPLSIFVSETATTPQETSASAETYTKVFCSYSHDDRQIADRVQVVCEMMDFEYLRDVHTLKSGEEWNPRLLELIEEADVFQLFWSLPASQSKYVRQEWVHALGLPDKPKRFVRPYFWQEPLPDVPPELGHLHFEYEPRLAG